MIFKYPTGGAAGSLSKSFVFLGKYNDFQAPHRGGGGLPEQIVSFPMEMQRFSSTPQRGRRAPSANH